ncbi:MAG TPA: glycosyltransferase [Saprospiraceae bacterium]|nr:glycosyltransferase [Saprospiraceae bacterium]
MQKPVFVLTVNSLAGPGNRWSKIVTCLAGNKTFDFRLIITQAFYMYVKSLNNETSASFKKLLKSNIIIYDRTHCKIFNYFVLYCHLTYLRFIGFNTIHSIMSLPFSLRLKKVFHFRLNYEVVGPVYADKIIRNEQNRHIDRFICVSPSIAERIKLNKKLEEKIFTYPIPFYKYNKVCLPEAKKNIVVFAHNFMVTRKNATLCAFLFAEIAPLYPDWSFYLLGKGRDGDASYSNLYKYLFEDQENIIFTHLRDISPVLARSKIFLSLNSINNYPSQSVLEAMQYDNYLIITDTGQSKDFVLENGVLVNVDYDDIKNALVLAMEDTSLEKKGKNSSILLKNRFAPEVFIQSLIDLYS